MSFKWNIVQLKDFAKFQEGYVNPSQRIPEYFDGDIKWLRATDLNNSYVYDTGRKLTEKGFKSAGKSALLFKPNTLAISKSGTIGRVGILKDYMCGNRAVINISIDSKKADSLFIFYVLIHKNYEIQNLATGSVQKNLYTSVLGSLEFMTPPLEKQQKIAKILGDLDKKIEINNQINETLEEMAQAIFKSWFVDFDPVRAKAEAKAAGKDNAGIIRAAMAVIASKTEEELAEMAQDSPDEYKKLEATAKAFPDAFVESELGLIPEGWEVSSLGKEYNITMGQSPKGESYNEEKEGTLFFQGRAEFGWRYPTPRLYTTDPKRMAQKGDILMSVRAPVGDFNIALEACCIGRGLSALRHKSGSQTYSFYQLLSLKSELDRFNGEGTVFGSINQTNLKNMQCLAPDDFVIDLFLKKFSKLDELIKTNALETISLTELRDSLLPKLLSGEIEV